MLKPNPSDLFPGASTVASNPVSAGDCCLERSVSLLASMCSENGFPYSILAGQIWMDISAEDLESGCRGAALVVESMEISVLEDGQPNEIGGDFAGTLEGEVWVGDAATWAACVLKVEQTVTLWSDAVIGFTAVQGGFQISPPDAYLYLLNACGRPSAVGWIVTWSGA